MINTSAPPLIGGVRGRVRPRLVRRSWHGAGIKGFHGWAAPRTAVTACRPRGGAAASMRTPGGGRDGRSAGVDLDGDGDAVGDDVVDGRALAGLLDDLAQLVGVVAVSTPLRIGSSSVVMRAW